jgi:zinc D-Ala-D-Ala carboxypeptidase
MQLSEHFSLAELTKSDTAARMGINNEPRAKVIEKLVLVCENILEPVRNHYGVPFSPSSGFRCLSLNRALGSSDGSQHVTGEAVDFEVPGISNKETAFWVRDNCDFDQIVLEFYEEEKPKSGWVHCSYRGDGKNRHDTFAFDGKTWSSLE